MTSLSQALALASAHYQAGRLDLAAEICRRILEVEPNHPDALELTAQTHNQQGMALKDRACLAEAAVCFERALQLKPDYARAHSYYLYAERYDSCVTPVALAEAHAEYDRRHAARFRSAWRAHDNSPEPARRLRLGFVSPAFSLSPVGCFLIGALEHLDRARCEVLCYSDRTVPDDLTARFQAVADVWRDGCALSDGQLAERIRADRVDILFDLAGHTPQNRLLTLARKPAPIQITWIDSVGTTGLSAIDYVLADHCLIPSGAEAHYTERVLRMPHDYVCYDPPAAAGMVGPLPGPRQGYVTCGDCREVRRGSAGPGGNPRRAAPARGPVATG